jgi:hypothetical protein
MKQSREQYQRLTRTEPQADASAIIKIIKKEKNKKKPKEGTDWDVKEMFPCRHVTPWELTQGTAS